MSRLLWISTLVLLVVACQSNTYGKKAPEDLIARDTLVMVLKDLSLIESHIQDVYAQNGIYKDIMRRSGDTVLSKYRLTADRLERSLDYYGSRQSDMESIYNQVLDSLNKEASKLPDNSFQIVDSSSPLNKIFP
jgi:hypothetical protein